MSEPLPRGFSRVHASARDWWIALTSSTRWAQLDSLARHYCVEVLQLREDLAVANSPRERATLRKQIRETERDLGLFQRPADGPARRYRRNARVRPTCVTETRTVAKKSDGTI